MTNTPLILFASTLVLLLCLLALLTNLDRRIRRLERKLDVVTVAKDLKRDLSRYSWVCGVCGKDNPITNTVCQNSTCKEPVRKL